METSPARQQRRSLNDRLWGTYLPDSSVHKCVFSLSLSTCSQQDRQFSSVEPSCSYCTTGVLPEGLVEWGSAAHCRFRDAPKRSAPLTAHLWRLCAAISAEKWAETFVLAAAEAGALRLQCEGGSSTVLSGTKGNQSAATALQV